MCNGWKLLTIVTKSSIFNLARFPDLPLKKNKKKKKKQQQKKKIKDTLLAEKNDSVYRDTWKHLVWKP